MEEQVVPVPMALMVPKPVVVVDPEEVHQTELQVLEGKVGVAEL
jgi:hypothetical protein